MNTLHAPPTMTPLKSLAVPFERYAGTFLATADAPLFQMASLAEASRCNERDARSTADSPTSRRLPDHTSLIPCDTSSLANIRSEQEASQRPENRFHRRAVATRTAPWGVAKTLFDRCNKVFLEDTGWMLLWAVPGIPAEGHPASGMATANWRESGALLADWGAWLVERDGIRPGRVTAPVVTATVDRELWRCLVRLFYRTSLSFVTTWREKEYQHRLIRGAMEDLGQGNVDTIRDLVVKCPPRSWYEEVSDMLFGITWDLLDTLCEMPTPPVAPGTWQLPAPNSQEVLRRARVYQYATAFLTIPYQCSLACLESAIRDTSSADLFGASGNLERSFEALRSVYVHWQDSASGAFHAFLSENAPVTVPFRREQIRDALVQGVLLPTRSVRDTRMLFSLAEREGLGQIADRLFDPQPRRTLRDRVPHLWNWIRPKRSATHIAERDVAIEEPAGDPEAARSTPAHGVGNPSTDMSSQV